MNAVELEINEEASGLIWKVYDVYSDDNRLIARLYCHKGYLPNNLELEEIDHE